MEDARDEIDKSLKPMVRRRVDAAAVAEILQAWLVYDACRVRE